MSLKDHAYPGLRQATLADTVVLVAPIELLMHPNFGFFQRQTSYVLAPVGATAFGGSLFQIPSALYDALTRGAVDCAYEVARRIAEFLGAPDPTRSSVVLVEGFWNEDMLATIGIYLEQSGYRIAGADLNYNPDFPPQEIVLGIVFFPGM